jgi:hypothetical protein
MMGGQAGSLHNLYACSTAVVHTASQAMNVGVAAVTSALPCLLSEGAGR